MKIVVHQDVSGTCVVAGTHIDFAVKAGKHTAKTDADVEVFRHLVDAGLAVAPEPESLTPADAAPAAADKE